MVALFKAIPLGVFLTLVIALFLGSGGATSGVLHVFGFALGGTRLYWSWMLFCLATGLAWALLLIIGD